MGQRRLWVIRVVLTVGQPLPVAPDKQTFSGSVCMSQRCTKTEGSAFRRYVCLSPTGRHSLVRPSVLVDFATNRNRSAIYSYALMTLETPLVRHRRDWPVSEPESARLHLA